MSLETKKFMILGVVLVSAITLETIIIFSAPEFGHLTKDNTKKLRQKAITKSIREELVISRELGMNNFDNLPEIQRNNYCSKLRVAKSVRCLPGGDLFEY